MPNRLQYEKSPYLLQHAENPVDWRPWGADAFEEARREDKPVLLSIGYSTCHWCHVMAHESFEDEAVAEAVNGAFLPIKVDREERPDVDAVYMAACIAQTGSGGWPLTVLLTPEQKPFWAGTYLPRRQLLSLLDQAARLWREDRGTLIAAGDALTEFLRREEAARPDVPKRELVESGAALFRRMFDRQWGGFGQAPKFPAATMWAAAFPGIPPTGGGWCPTLRRCSTTTPCWQWPIWRRISKAAAPITGLWSGARWTMYWRSSQTLRADSAAARTPTARG